MIEEEQFFFGEDVPEEHTGDVNDQTSLDLDFEGLRETNGLDTSPEWKLLPPTCLPPPEVTSYHAVVRKVVDMLDLPLLTTELKSNTLTEMLHSAS